MKKTLSIMIAIILITVLAGCSDQSKQTSKYEAPTIAQATAVTAASAEPETTQAPTDALQETAAPVTETTEPLSAEDYIKIYEEGSYIWKGSNTEESYILPLFNIDSSDAENINGELMTAYEEALRQMKNHETNEQIPEGTYAVSYEAYLNGTILSLCVEEKSSAPAYLVYNIDVATGKEVKNDGIAAHFGMTTEALHDSILAAVDSDYRSRYSNLAEKNSSRYQMTVSEENISAARPFIAENNELKVTCTWYWEAMIGQGQYITDVSLD